MGNGWPLVGSWSMFGLDRLYPRSRWRLSIWTRVILLWLTRWLLVLIICILLLMIGFMGCACSVLLTRLSRRLLTRIRRCYRRRLILRRMFVMNLSFLRSCDRRNLAPRMSLSWYRIRLMGGILSSSGTLWLVFILMWLGANLRSARLMMPRIFLRCT